MGPTLRNRRQWAQEHKYGKQMQRQGVPVGKGSWKNPKGGDMERAIESKTGSTADQKPVGMRTRCAHRQEK